MRHFSVPVVGSFALLCVAALAALALLAPGPAEASDHCPSPDGGNTDLTAGPSLEEGDDALVLAGGGWGHGVGMSQYGALGAAVLGCTYQQILGTYFPGTVVEARDEAEVPTVRVGLFQRVSEVYVVAVDGDVPWQHCDGGCEEEALQMEGETWRVRSTSDGAYRIAKVNGDGSTSTVAEGLEGGHLRVVHEGTVIDVQDEADDPDLRHRMRWGHHRLIADSDRRDRLHSVQWVTSGDGHTGMERYLWGIAEVPSSWDQHALRAQVLAARSFTAKRIQDGGRSGCHCHVLPTTLDQVYRGWAQESQDAAAGGGWRHAVDATEGEVVTHDGTIAQTFYSSSHGGIGDRSRDVWFADIPYLQAVDTSRWEEEVAHRNRYDRWRVAFTPEQAASRLGFETFESLSIEETGAGGRPVSAVGSRQAGALAVGYDDECRRQERRFSGEDLRGTANRLGGGGRGIDRSGQSIPGVRSARFVITTNESPRIVRCGGANRVATAANVSRHGWDDATTVVIARSDDPADALAGAGLAGQLGASLLLTSSSRLSDAAAAEVERLGATEAVLLGGEAALSDRVKRDLEDIGLDVTRVFGQNRAATAAEIAERLGSTSEAFLVYDAHTNPNIGWPDALSASALAARRANSGDPKPILLTGETLPDETLDALADRGVSEVTIVGGTSVVSQSIQDELEDLGYVVERVAGGDRFETSRDLSDGDGAAGPLIIATGDHFPDGLAAGALAGRLDASLVLVPSVSLGTTHAEWFGEAFPRDPPIITVGGRKAVSASVMASVRIEVRAE